MAASTMTGPEHLAFLQSRRTCRRFVDAPVSREVLERRLEAGIVAQPASLAWNVLRIEPPLTIQDGEIDRLAEAVGSILGQYASIPSLLADVWRRMGEQAWNRGEFR
jgi:adenosylmethionine-8-amino-7-oxononanoate aminotransferase